MFNTVRYVAVSLLLIVLAGAAFVVAATNGFSAVGIVALIGALAATAVALSYYLSVRTKRHGATPIPR